ncbi:MAG TPA: ferrous iron transporter B [Myxococcaceae bacterium]|nr:ferrous iron transporter B [Myxococcaceae bacterium]
MSARAERADVLLVGNPNSGKSLLFSRLTGIAQKVANYPGVTTEVRSGHAGGLVIHDYPGIYSLEPLTLDERVAIERLDKALADSTTKAIVCVLDATRLERSLYLLLELLPRARAVHVPVIAAVNIIDELVGPSARLDLPGLSAALRCHFVGVSAKTGQGLEELRSTLHHLDRESPWDERCVDPGSIEDRKRVAQRLARAYGPRGDVLLKSQERLDRVFLSTWLGLPVFAVVMAVLFQAIFTWAAPLMSLVKDGVAAAGTFVGGLLPAGIAHDFVQDAVFAGIGAFLTFVPQIFILFLIIGALEDSGYLARAAVMLHRPLGWFGLSGRSFLPLLSGHACAIPAMMAARTIESPRRRLITVMVIPFVSCSARLPIYALLIGGFIPARTIIPGLLGLQGVVFAGVYVFGIVNALLAAAVLDRLTRRKLGGRMADAPFVVELPSYRLPSVKPIVLAAVSRSGSFVRRAAPIIFGVVVAVWFLGYFPKGAGHLEQSWLAGLGHLLEPVFRPMGADWKSGVGIVTSFVAREVFVGTMGTLNGLEDAGTHLGQLSTQLQLGGMGLAAALALLVFYALSLQCASTLAVMRKETGSARAPVFSFLSMTALAYVGAVVTFHLARAFGAA